MAKKAKKPDVQTERYLATLKSLDAWKRRLRRAFNQWSDLEATKTRYERANPNLIKLQFVGVKIKPVAAQLEHLGINVSRPGRSCPAGFLPTVGLGSSRPAGVTCVGAGIILASAAPAMAASFGRCSSRDRCAAGRCHGRPARPEPRLPLTLALRRPRAQPRPPLP
jgi:hypothetical protein